MINKALKTLLVYNGIFTLAGGLFGPLYALYVVRVTPSVIAVSVSWAIFLISSTLVTFVISKVGDSIKEKEYLLMAGFLVRAIAWISYIFVDSILTLVILQIFIGIGEALITALNEKGIPTPLAATHLRAPMSRMGILTQEELERVHSSSMLGIKYNEAIDRASAYEILEAKLKNAKAESEEEEVEVKTKARTSKEKEEPSVQKNCPRTQWCDRWAIR